MVVRSQNLLLTLSLLLVVVLLSSCSGSVSAGSNVRDSAAALEAAQKGSQGLEISFVPNYPPSQLYDINEFVALLELRNKGNFDLTPADCFVQITGFDPNILRGINFIQSCGELEGKDVYNLDGGFTQLEYQSTNIDLPSNSYEYSPTLNVVMCYAYETRASPSVCVDPQFYQVTSQQKGCQVKDVSLAGGQGAPVAVSSVNVDMAGDTAIFEINVRNVGGGRVISPFADIRSCGGASLDYDDLDRLTYNVQMTGGSLISCVPTDRTIRLHNEAAKIICKFRINGATAFETPLQITLNYNYLDSIQQRVQIIETP